MADEQTQLEKGDGVPWSLVAAILVIVALGLIAYYFFH